MPIGTFFCFCYPEFKPMVFNTGTQRVVDTGGRIEALSLIDKQKPFWHIGQKINLIGLFPLLE